MSDYATKYGKAITAAPVVESHFVSPWELFKRQFKAEPHHLWDTPATDHNLRAIAADAYTEDTGDEHGAELLRQPGHVVIDEAGRIRHGEFSPHDHNAWLQRFSHYMDSVLPGGYQHRWEVYSPFLGNILNNPWWALHDAEERGDYPYTHPPHVYGEHVANFLQDDIPDADEHEITPEQHGHAHSILNNVRKAPYERIKYIEGK